MTTTTTTTAPASLQALPEHVRVIITAAVASLFDGQGRVVDVTEITIDPRYQQWGMEGRRMQLSSHFVR